MDQERSAILAVAILAALCDGQQDPGERSAILALSLGEQSDYDAVLHAVQAGTLRLGDVAPSIVTDTGRRLAFEAATAVCNADGASNVAELAFLESLRTALNLGTVADEVQRAAATLAAAPLAAPAPSPAAGSGANTPDIDRLIRDAAILNGALELLPATLASMAILPLQMRLVYRIGGAYGFQLGREHARDFIATLGVGLTAQFLEGFARKLLGGLFGGLGRQTASSGMAFISTYAIGEAARRYYASGRKLEAVQLREIYQSMLTEARSAAGRAQEEIQRRAGALRSGSLADVLRSV